MKIITVQSKLSGQRVALWERDPAHPGGEVFVAGSEPVRVALTVSVRRRLQRGILQEVTSPAGDGAKQPSPAPPASTPSETQDETAEPWPGYSEQSVEEIVERLPGLGEAERQRVLAYEQANKNRKGVIHPLVNWNS